MSQHSARSLMAAVAGLIATNPALAGRVLVDDGTLPARGPSPAVTASTYRLPIRGARLSLDEARKVYATAPADQARLDAAAERRARRQARNLRNEAEAARRAQVAAVLAAHVDKLLQGKPRAAEGQA